MQLIEDAVKAGLTQLSEYDSKKLLKSYNIPVSREIFVEKPGDLDEAVKSIGFPLVMKGCSSAIGHKTGKNLIRLDLRTIEEAKSAFTEIKANMNGVGGGVLVQEMVRNPRELVVGMIRDPQFGPCVMFGLGGIFTEVLNDATFRVAPLTKKDALQMIDEIKGRKILDAIRGMEAIDRDLLADIIVNVSRIGMENPAVKEIDINPLIPNGSTPVAVDALVVLEGK